MQGHVICFDPRSRFRNRYETNAGISRKKQLNKVSNSRRFWGKYTKALQPLLTPLLFTLPYFQFSCDVSLIAESQRPEIFGTSGSNGETVLQTEAQRAESVRETMWAAPISGAGLQIKTTGIPAEHFSIKLKLTHSAKEHNCTFSQLFRFSN